MAYQCGVCGDSYESIHDCWLARHTQEPFLPPTEDCTTFLPLGEAPEDPRIPERIRRADISNL